MKQGKNTSSAILIERKQSNGNIRLIVQLYASGSKVQESTGIIIKPTDSRKEKSEKRMLAEQFRKKREEELKDVVLGVKKPVNRLDERFLDYFDNVALQYSSSTKYIFNNARNFIIEYGGENITFRQITKEWIRGFRSFLLGAKSHYAREIDGKKVYLQISQNTASNIFARVVSTLNRAASEDVIQYSPASGVEGIPNIESKRCYLNEDELQLLMDTPCMNQVSRRAFFFSCFTGLRYSDIRNLSWDNIEKTPEGYCIAITMQKTSTLIYQHISEQASLFLGERTEGKVFKGLLQDCSVNDHLDKWAKKAGLTKKVTFHVARHTFATLLLKHKTDLYTVSKLLGHRKITTTQIYAKIVDETKIEAVNSLNGIITMTNDVKNG